MSITPWEHQLEIADQGYKILQENAMVYLAMEERTGKSIAALLIAEMANVVKVLIVSKKRALDYTDEEGNRSGWIPLLEQFEGTKWYQAINYHQVQKIDTTDWDLVILDEAHNYISAFPNKSGIWKNVRKYTKGAGIIYLSATPNAQSLAQLYHQFALSDWSVWKEYSTFKKWHKDYGIPYTIWINQRQVEKWDRTEEERVRARVQHLFIAKTRKELGFKHEPKDKVHYVPLSDWTKKAYNTILKQKVYWVDGVDILYDTTAKLRAGLHMIEGGVAKHTEPGLSKRGNPILKDIFHVLENEEKILYIKDNWGDNSNTVIMYNYIAEGIKLRAAFKNATILQATSYAEGIDLSGSEHLIIYSQDFSTARHTQRRARQANLFRNTPITVHLLLVKGGISEEVYETVVLNKTNYVDSYFTGTTL